MKVVLTALNAKFIHSNLAVRSLKEYTRNLNYECVIREFTVNDRKEKILEEIMTEKADIVAFSCYIWNIDYVVQLATLIKTIDSGIVILYGGPEVSYDSEKFLLDNPGEYLIDGEGEETYKEFIQFKLGEKEIDSIKGIYYKIDRDLEKANPGDSINIGYNGPRELMDMNSTVFAYTPEDELENKIVYYEAARGCPFKCKYCLSSTMSGVRFLDIHRVKAELKYFIDRRVSLVKFVDRTFNCNLEYSREIWKYLIGVDTKTTFHFEISADLLKDEDIEILKRAPKGRFQFEVGVQSTNRETLKNISRFASFQLIKEKVQKIKEGGNIKQHLDLIAGLPGEDYESFKRSFDEVYNIKPEEIQLGFLKLLKGSSMREESESWGMAYSPFAPYEILKSRDISYFELNLLKKVEEMVDKYYNSQKFSNIIEYFMKYYSSAFDFFFDLGMFFEKMGYFKRNISSAEYYKVFLQFNDEKIKENNIFISEIIKFDYLKYNKKKWLPEFLYREVNKDQEIIIRKALEPVTGKFDANRLHLEKFRINMEHFINNGSLYLEDNYYLFSDADSDDVRNVTAHLFQP